MTPNDLKTRQILDAAMTVFSRYGFRKTSMLDIAEEAGISRAALYLYFKNKEDIFRSGSARLHTEVQENAELALQSQEHVMVRLERALSSFALGLLAPIDASPHGQELVDANMALAADITGGAKAWLQLRIEQTLRVADAEAQIRLSATGASAADMAAMIVAALDGFKHAMPLGEALRPRLALFMRVLAAALHAKP